jgi:acyl-CoA reductase-like NAD-dependent aldehyde dehydrogenase
MVASAPGESTVQVPNLVEGVEIEAGDGQWAEKRSPADGTALCRFARSGAVDIDAAVAAARRAQPAWADRTAVERGEIVRAAAQLLAERADELVSVVCAETGKPRRDALGELKAAVEMGYFVAGEGRRLYGHTTTSAVPHKTVMLVRAPIGVAGLIVAANTPLPNYAWKVFPAVLCGNAAVLKPSEDTPWSAHLFATLLHEAGLPAGVLNVVQGLGPEAGSALVAHPDVDLVSFTGSSQVGREIQTVAGARVAKVCLEMGGKNPLVVCDDADLDGAVKAAALSAFSNAGQRCAAGSRIIVFDEVYDEFRERLVAATQDLRLGTDDDADLGPVVNERAVARILDAVEAAMTRGAKLLTGGRRAGDGPAANGYFVEPTLLEDVDPADPISTTELFGPVSCLYRVRDFDEAVELCNDSPFGLTAAIHTRSIHRGMRFAERAQAGMVVVNGPTYGSEPHMPFGGFKQSGNGFREAGTEALDAFSDWKSVCLIHDPTLT